MAMEAVPAGGVRDDVNGRLGASRASGRTPARHNPKMGYRDVWWCYGRSGGFEVWRDVFAFNTREPVIIPLIAEICRPTLSLRSGLRTRSSSRWMRRRCRSAGRCMRAWSGATPTTSPSQHRNRTPCRERINNSDTRTQARPRNTGTEPRALGRTRSRSKARRLALATPEPNLVQALTWPYCIHILDLALAPPELNLVQGMPGLQSTFAMRLTRFHGQQGPGWQGRSKAPLVEDAPHLARVCDYLPLHPVRAGVVPADRVGE